MSLISAKVTPVDIGAIWKSSVETDLQNQGLSELATISGSPAVNTNINDDSDFYMYTSMASLKAKINFLGTTLSIHTWTWGVQSSWETNSAARNNNVWISTDLANEATYANWVCTNTVATG